MLIRRTFLLPLLLASAVPAAKAAGDRVSYNFQVRPILAEKCFKCHGSDEKNRKGKLRLDDRAAALAKEAFLPGKPDDSELIKRIVTTDEDELMPPVKDHRPVSKAELAVLRDWIAQGAEYAKHWAFIPPVKAPVPTVKTDAALRPIDAFVQAKLEAGGITPAASATREQWLRRVTFDLTGLPPTLEEIDTFLADSSADPFARVVDRLLASGAYGERMAIEWLDVARFADTFGRHEDDDCQTWPYRDWVIRAFTQNMPYDQFITLQTAGDMLPGATQDTYLATAFNRLHQMSNEAGSNEDEFRWDSVFDRVRTNGTAFMGLSLECARCHDHKYDPISMRDFYGLASFLNNIDELGLYSRFTDAVPAPSMFVYEGDGERAHGEIKLQIALKEREMAAMLPAARERFAAWLKTGAFKPELPKPLAHLEFERIDDDKKIANLADPEHPAEIRLKSRLTEGRSHKGLLFKGDNSASFKDVGDYRRTHPFSMAIWLKPAASSERAVIMHHSRAGLDAASRGYEVLLENDRPSFALCHFWPGNAVRIRATHAIPINEWTQLAVTYDGSSRAAGMHIYVNGQLAETEVIRDNLYKDILYNDDLSEKDKVERDHLAIGGRYNDNAIKDAVVDGFYFFDRELSAAEMGMLAGISTTSRPDAWFAWWLREIDPAWKNQAAKLRALRDEENALSMKVREIMVMKERPGARRPTPVLTRGKYDAPGKPVEPGTPESIFPFPTDYSRDRIGYAKWLTDPRNPLTARVFVNRVWQMFFGRGIVSTSEDFGMQGQLPTHPELLDWLAVDFVERGWNVKDLCRSIALSATYRQSSIPADAKLMKDDPENRLLARGPRLRLTAEQMRDNALAVSGLLNRKVGGEPVKPYQPAGVWEESGTQHDYAQSHGPDLYRRSLYTFWRRTMPPPSMTVFDAPTREFCRSRRDKSATPLQALVVFDDVQIIEAARVLAEKLVREFPSDDAARARKAWRLLTGQQPNDSQLAVLTRLLAAQRAHYAAAADEARELLHKNGETQPDDKLPATEVAATTLLARALFGYDECLMKP